MTSIGADQVWDGSDEVRAQTGRGITVAVIDSGINTTHNALKGRVLVTHDFTGGDGQDHYGHGTHVAAIIAGQRRQDGRDPGLPRHRAGRVSAQPARARRRRVGDGERRDRGDRLDDRAPAGIQRPDHQPVARRAGAAAVSRRSVVRGGGARGAGGAGGGGGGGQLRQDGGRQDGDRRDHVAGQQPVCDCGGRDRHARHGAAVGRHAGDRTARRGRRATTWC